MHAENIDAVADRLSDVCRVTAPGALLPEFHGFFQVSGLSAAIARRDTPMLSPSAMTSWSSRQKLVPVCTPVAMTRHRLPICQKAGAVSGVAT